MSAGAASACIGTPLSWLVLERYGLGELGGAESARVASHLESCAVCRACFARIEEDARPLAAVPAQPARAKVTPLFARRGATIVGALALAASVLLAVRFGSHGETRIEGGPRVANVKGGSDVVVSLVREGEPPWAAEAGLYRSGDRFKAVVTCPPSLDASWDLAVVDASGVSFPLDPAPGRVACGNEVPLPGAFRLTGDAPEDVCVVWSEGDVVDRAMLSARDAVTRAHHACVHLEAAH